MMSKLHLGLELQFILHIGSHIKKGNKYKYSPSCMVDRNISHATSLILHNCEIMKKKVDRSLPLYIEYVVGG